MCWGVVASDRCTLPLVWFEKGGVGTDLKVMQEVVLPWIADNYISQGFKYVWQQDGAPGHTSKRTQECLSENLEFWPANLWPPASPDLSPLDYAMWGVMEARTCATPHRNVNDLKTSVEREWAALSGGVIIKSCQSFRPRIEAMLAVDGGHFER